jgi:hypothetical protein
MSIRDFFGSISYRWIVHTIPFTLGGLSTLLDQTNADIALGIDIATLITFFLISFGYIATFIGANYTTHGLTGQGHALSSQGHGLTSQGHVLSSQAAQDSSINAFSTASSFGANPSGRCCSVQWKALCAGVMWEAMKLLLIAISINGLTIGQFRWSEAVLLALAIEGAWFMVNSSRDAKAMMTMIKHALWEVRWIGFLYFVLVYVGALAGYLLFRTVTDDDILADGILGPDHPFRNIVYSFITTFAVSQGDNLGDLGRAYQDLRPWAWIFWLAYSTVSYVLMATLFMAVFVSAVQQHQSAAAAIADNVGESSRGNKQASAPSSHSSLHLRHHHPHRQAPGWETTRLHAHQDNGIGFPGNNNTHQSTQHDERVNIAV